MVGIITLPGVGIKRFPGIAAGPVASVGIQTDAGCRSAGFAPAPEPAGQGAGSWRTCNKLTGARSR